MTFLYERRPHYELIDGKPVEVTPGIDDILSRWASDTPPVFDACGEPPPRYEDELPAMMAAQKALDALPAATRIAALKRNGLLEPGTVYAAPKVGRNDPCHCGSGKKFKKCHGA